MPISEAQFAQCFWEIWDRLEATSSTPLDTQAEARNIEGKPVYFHYLTLMALHCYMQEEVGTAIIECGIGGEYDTTNVLVKPSVTGVTSLGIDHEALLGDTIESIAWHKAGIFKQGVPAFSVLQPAKAMAVMQARARECGVELQVVPEHAALRDIQLGLQGDFQKTNASLAIAICASHLSRLGFSGMTETLDPDGRLPQEFMVGLESARLAGRCDMRPDRQVSGLTWYVDGGHTLESIETAGRWFASSGRSSTGKIDKTRILIFNQQSRDASSLAHRLHSTLATALQDDHPFTHAIFCPNTTYKSSGYKPDLVSINTNKDDVGSLRVQKELAASWDQIDANANVHVLGTIEEAVERARQIAAETNRNADVLVTGSLHLVGGVVEVLESEAEHIHQAWADKQIR